jgi:prephenate dehydratase
MSMMIHEGYAARIEYDDEHDMLAGYVINTRDVITFFGTSLDDLKREFATSIEEHLAYCKSKGIKPAHPIPENGLPSTSFVFRVRDIPAALYKALGGFATNGVNITKLESYQLDGANGGPGQTQFYADIEGIPDDPDVREGFEELKFFSEKDSVKMIGVHIPSTS